jgi:hypothetical protein
VKLEDAMEWNFMWRKPKVIGISRESSPVLIMMSKTSGECGIFKITRLSTVILL